MLRRFLRRHIGVALGFSAAMTWFIVFKLVPRPQDPWWSQLLQVLWVFSVLFLSQLGISALIDPEVGAKLEEKLKLRQARRESQQALRKARHKARRELWARQREEARRRLKEAWRELKGERKTKP